MTRSIAIRTDASTQIGSGHVMRTLELARRLRDKGYHVRYWCKPFQGHLIHYIQEQGFEVTEFPTEQGEVEVLSEGIETLKPLWLVIDHYGIDITVEQQLLGRYGTLLLCYDDLFKSHACDALLNQNIYATEAAYQRRVPEGAVVMAGIAYGAMRREFYEAQRLPRHSHKVPKLLVTLGGSDPNNITLHVLQALERYSEPLEIDVVVGPSNQHVGQLMQQAARLPSCHILQNVKDMAALMHEADAAVTAAGQTTIEALFMQLPTVNIQIADNQREIAAYLDAEKLSVSLAADVDAMVLCEAVHGVLTGERISKASLAEVATHIGTASASDVMHCLPFQRFSIEPTVGEDVDALFTLANDPDVRRNSLQTDAIAYEEHQAWFARMMADEAQMLLSVKDATGAFMGQCRFDCRGVSRAVIGISIVPEARGCGIATAIISRAVGVLFERFPQRVVEAVIKTSNVASLKGFQRAGFQQSGSDADTVTLHLTKAMYANDYD